MGFLDRLQHGWNAFRNKEPTKLISAPGQASYYRPDRPRLSHGNDRTIVTAVYNRIAMDVAAIELKHVKLDENGRYSSDVESGLDYCLTTEANIDQTGRALRQDIVMSLLDEGVIALVPVDTTDNPYITQAFEINTLRVGKILQWKPKLVQVRLYDENDGEKKDIWIPKKQVAIIENPFYAVMNEPNSTAKRLMRKLALLDQVDEQAGSGKLDLIIQLPYTVKGEIRRNQAEERRKNIEQQLNGSKLGIAYLDATERVTQLNRSLDNNLLKQIEGLQSLLYSQLGITKEIMEGSADEKTMLNYNNRTIEPIVSAISDEIKRKFLSKTARTQGHTIMFFKDPFKLVPIDNIAEIADKFTRNEIMTSNEIRQIVGMKPSDDPNADELRNKNLNQQADPNAAQGMDSSMMGEGQNGNVEEDPKDTLVNDTIANLEAEIDRIIAPLMGEEADERDAIVNETIAGIEDDINKILGKK